MMQTVTEFLHMGGYGFYVWGAYGCVLATLFVQWLMPWRRWKEYIKKYKYE